MAATTRDGEVSISFDEIDPLVLHLFRLVADGLAKATAAFLAGDVDGARRLIAGDTEFGTLQEEIEQLVEDRLGSRADEHELPLLLAILRIVPELDDLHVRLTAELAEGSLAPLWQSRWVCWRASSNGSAIMP